MSAITDSGRRAGVFTVVVLAALLRLFYFVDISNGPMARLHEWDQSDMNFFHQWALSIAGGNWLSDGSLHPFHDWNRAIAREVFAAHPELRRELVEKKPDADPDRALWDRWYGGRTLHQEPLYAYAVALFYRLLGDKVLWVFAFQLLLGVLSCAMLSDHCWRRMGPVAGVAAGGIALLAGPMLFHEGLLLRESSCVFAAIALLWALDRFGDSASSTPWILMGLGLGTAIMLRVTFAPIWLLFLYKSIQMVKIERRRARFALLLSAAMALPPLPAMVRNLALGVPPLAFAANGGIMTCWALTPETGPYAGAHIDFPMAAEAMYKGDGRPAGVARACLARHPDWKSLARMYWWRLLAALSWYEFPDNANILVLREYSPALRCAALGFLPIAALGLPGLVLLGARPGPARLSVWFVGWAFLPVIGFIALSRYRLPLLALLIPAAAATVAQLVGWLRERRLAGTLSLMLAVGLAALVIGRPLPTGVGTIRLTDVVVPFKHCYQDGFQQATSSGRWAVAAAILQEVLDHAPLSLRETWDGEQPPAPGERQALAWYKAIFQSQSKAYQEAGDGERARRAAEKAVRIR